MALSAALLVGSCASSGGPGIGAPDGSSLDGSLDAFNMDGAGMDGAAMDGDAGDVPDTAVDSGPAYVSSTCEMCETHANCAPGSYCVSLTVGGRACVPGCVPDLPSCPRTFSCVLDISSGVDTTVCLPIGGGCCVDEDADSYGQGVGCMGNDCDDADPNINPGMSETCNGIDDDCDMVVDNPPTDCVSGRCAALMDGTYEAVVGADCVSASCAMGTITPCALFTCEDSGELGNRCATTCAPMGAPDDDTYCIAAAHCDAGMCLDDVPNGGTCDEDSDCTAGHCDNGFCCDTGTCCGVTGDCPGGGAVARICETPATCQGSRGQTQCVSSQCQTMSGIADDTACDSTVEALNCGLFNSIFCTGAAAQMAPSCPSACMVDAECVTGAHCTVALCLPDLPPGGPCTRTPECQAGLACVDGVCCMSACTGTCEACNVAGSAGTCSPVAALSDPAGECPGFSCASYFDGFGVGEDVCYRRQDASNAAATCNGARACVDAPSLCATQPRGAIQINCDNTCQAPTTGTCTGTTAGACSDLDDPGIRNTCGVGECARSVQRCIGGTPQMCVPGIPALEVCNGLDDDCVGGVDNGPPASLCTPVTGAATYTCIAGTCGIGSCGAGRYDVNGTYSDGCECLDDTSGNSCAVATNLGSIPAGSAGASRSGSVMPGQADWYRVDFPATGRPGGGVPRIRLTGAGAANFRLDVRTGCGAASNINCGTEGGNSAAVTDWSLRDSASLPGPNAYSGPHSQAWPTTVYVRVTRIAPATTCGAAAYTVSITR